MAFRKSTSESPLNQIKCCFGMNCILPHAKLTSSNSFYCGGDGCEKRGHLKCQLKDADLKDILTVSGNLTPLAAKVLSVFMMEPKKFSDDLNRFFVPFCPSCRSKPHLKPDASQEIGTTLAGLSDKLDQVSDELAELKTNRASPPHNNIEEIIKSATREVSKELQAEAEDYELRSRTLIVDGIKETDDSDKDTISSLVKSLGSKVKPLNIRRLGSIVEDAKRPRKIKVILPSSEEKEKLCKKESRVKLRESMPGVYVEPSRTPEERRRLFLLRQRARELNEEGAFSGGDRWVVDRYRFRLWKMEAGVFNHDLADNDYDNWLIDWKNRNRPATPVSSSSSVVMCLCCPHSETCENSAARLFPLRTPPRSLAHSEEDLLAAAILRQS